MVPWYRTWLRVVRLAFALGAELAVAISRGGFAVTPPRRPRAVTPWSALLYDRTFLSALVFVLVLVAAYCVVAVLTLIAEGRVPRRAGPVEVEPSDSPSAPRAETAPSALAREVDLLSWIQDLQRRAADAEARIGELECSVPHMRVTRAGKTSAQRPESAPSG